MRKACREHPENADLLEITAGWLHPSGPKETIPLLESSLEKRPHSVWTHRELACEHIRAGTLEEALQFSQSALDLDPQDPVSHYVQGLVHESAHRSKEASECYRRTIRLDVDHLGAVQALMEESSNNREAVANLSLVMEEMDRQVSDGSIVPVYRDIAHRFLDNDHILQQLERFCRERPDLSETWRALKDQGLDMNRQDVVDRAVKEMSERFPLVARTWLEVAEVYRASGEIVQEVEALGKAMKLAPAWDVAARRLARALEYQGRYEEAVAMLKRAIEVDPLTIQNHGCLAELLWRMEEREEAFECLRNGLAINAEYPWGWEMIGQWAAVLERREAVDDLIALHEGGRASDVDWLLACADAYSALGDLEKALEYAGKGGRVDPENVDVVDVQVRFLSDLGRIPEAMELLAGASKEGVLPRSLEGRRGWLLMEACQPVEAIEVMTKLSSREPDYGWVQRQLAEWLSEREDWKELEGVAKRLTRLMPNDSAAWGYLADASMNLENKTQAREAFAKAYGLDPHYPFAGRNLLDFQIEEKAYEEAARTLETLEHYTPSPWVTIDGIDLALVRGDELEIQRRVEAILQSEESHAGHLEHAASLFAKRQRGSKWESFLKDRLKEGREQDALNEALVEAWTTLQCRAGRLPKARRFLEAQKDPAVTGGGWAVLLKEIERVPDRKTFVKLVKRHRDLFRAHPAALNAAGNGLVNFDQEKLVLGLYGDWQERAETLSASDFLNIAIGIEAIDGRHATRGVREEGLSRFPSDQMASFHLAALAFLDAEGGEVAQAEHRLERIEVSRLSTYYEVTEILARAMVAAIGGKEAEALEGVRKARVVHPPLRSDAGLYPLYIVAVEKIAPYLASCKGKSKRLFKQLGMPRKAPRSSGGEGRGWILFGVIFVLWIILKAILNW